MRCEEPAGKSTFSDHLDYRLLGSVSGIATSAIIITDKLILITIIITLGRYLGCNVKHVSRTSFSWGLNHLSDYQTLDYNKFSVFFLIVVFVVNIFVVPTIFGPGALFGGTHLIEYAEDSGGVQVINANDKLAATQNKPKELAAKHKYITPRKTDQI